MSRGALLLSALGDKRYLVEDQGGVSRRDTQFKRRGFIQKENENKKPEQHPIIVGNNEFGSAKCYGDSILKAFDKGDWNIFNDLLDRRHTDHKSSKLRESRDSISTPFGFITPGNKNFAAASERRPFRSLTSVPKARIHNELLYNGPSFTRPENHAAFLSSLSSFKSHPTGSACRSLFSAMGSRHDRNKIQEEHRQPLLSMENLERVNSTKLRNSSKGPVSTQTEENVQRLFSSFSSSSQTNSETVTLDLPLPVVSDSSLDEEIRRGMIILDEHLEETCDSAVSFINNYHFCKCHLGVL